MFEPDRKKKTSDKKQSSLPLKVNKAKTKKNFPASTFLMLKRILGNQNIQAVFRRKQQDDSISSGHHMTINQPGDKYEQEADRAAEKVMSPVQQNSANEQDTFLSEPGRFEKSANRQSGSGKALPSETRQFFESRFGHSFENVQVHSDSSANQSAHALGARAHTHGESITFGAGEYQPSTSRGKKLLAHELAHVVQQSHTPRHAGSQTVANSLSTAPASGIQRALVATGDAAGFVAMANSIIAVQHQIRVSSTGAISIQTTNIQGPPTRDAVELLRVLRIAINDAKTTSIEFIRGSTSTRASDRSVIVGNYGLARVDLDDISAFGFTSSHSREGDNAAVQLVHEITEQYRKQVHGEGFATAHRAGYAAQERLLGATLVNETPMTPIGGNRGEVTTTYRYPDGREVDVITRMDFGTGQIVNVRRVIR